MPQSLLIAQEIQKAKNNLTQLETVKKELQKLEKKQRVEVQKNLSEAQTAYQRQIKPILDKYSKDYSDAKFKLETLAQTNKDTNVNLINIPYPDLPEFQFKIPIEIDAVSMQAKLSDTSNQKLKEIIDWSDVTSFQEIYDTIDSIIATANKTIVENVPTSTQYASFGDMVFPVSKGTDTTLTFIICSQTIRPNWFAITININTSDSVYDMSYYVKLQDGTSSPVQNTFTDATNATLALYNFFGPEGLNQNPNNPVVGFHAEFKLTTDNKVYSIDVSDFKLTDLYTCSKPYHLSLKDSNITNDVAPKGFGFRQVGIADYKKVVTEICGYHAGEVAHIENIMAGETREKVTTKTHISEVTDVQSQEIETEKLSDTTSTERFEMQTEIAKMQQEQTAYDAHANIHSDLTPNTTLDAGANFATNTTKEESNRQAVTQAKEQTQRAMERIVSRIKTSKMVKVTDEFVEANSHIFDNRGSKDNISGVYRFINAVYKN